MTKSSVTFLRVRGIPIGAHWTWSLVFLLLARILATGYFPQAVPHLPRGAYLALALLTSLLFFIAIVLHELGHAFRARREGMRIEGITLWLFGGVARFAGMFPSPGAELRVAVAGPAVSLLIALLMWGVSGASHALGLPAAVGAVAGYLAVNGAILIMNVVGVDAFWYIWVPFGFAAWWMIAREETVAEMSAIGGESGAKRLRGGG